MQPDSPRIELPKPAHGRIVTLSDGSVQLYRPWYIGASDVNFYVKHLRYVDTSVERGKTGGGLTAAEGKDAIDNARLLCQRNPAFLAHEYCEIGLPEGGTRRFDAWTPGQRYVYRAIQLLRLQGKPVRVIILKARREGVSTLCMLLAFWRTAFFSRANALIAGHEEDSAGTCFEIFKLFYHSLPPALRPAVSKFNKDEVLFDRRVNLSAKEGPPDDSLRPGLGSLIRTRTVAPGGGTKERQGKGRSQTIHFLDGTEAAYWDEPRRFWGGVSQCVGDVPETYAILESTGNAFGWFTDQWNDAAQGWELVSNPVRGTVEWACVDAKKSKSDMVPVFLSWLAEPRYQVAFPSESDRAYFAKHLDADEKTLRNVYGATLEQLHWRQKTLFSTKIGGDLQLFHQEYPTTPQEAFASSGRKVFSVPSLRWAETRLLSEPVPATRWDFWIDDADKVQRHENPDGPVWIYREPVPGADYVFGCDASYGKAKGDKGTTNFLRCDTWEQVAVISGRLDEDAQADLNCALGRYYGAGMNGGEVLAVIEINGPGIAVLRRMEAAGYGNFYFRVVPDDITQKPTKAVGWWTSAKTRSVMVSTLKSAVRDMPSGRGLILNHSTTIQEMTGWVLHTGFTGKTKEQPGPNGYDDEITSLGVALVGGCIEAGYGAPIVSHRVGNPNKKARGEVEEAPRRPPPAEDPEYMASLFDLGGREQSTEYHSVLGYGA